MVQNKKVSIITCFYNEEKYLAKAIDSILTQTYSNIELILVNDGSTDRSEEIVKSYKDDRIIYISYQGNKRQAYARNKGIDVATGEYIGFFDSDDIMMPDKIEKQVKLLCEDVSVVLAGGNYAYINDNAETGKVLKNSRYRTDEQIRAFMLYADCIALGAALFRREVIEKHQIRFEESKRLAEDYQFFVSMLPYGKFINMNECLYNYRVNNTPKSALAVQNHDKVREKEVREVLEQVWRERGFLLDSEDFSFIYTVLNRNLRVLKPKKVLQGIKTYKKIKKQIKTLELKEEKWILKYYRQQWLRTYHTYWLICKIVAIEG